MNVNTLESKRLVSPTLFRYILGEMLFSFVICFCFFCKSDTSFGQGSS